MSNLKKVEREQVKPPITTSKLEQVIKLSMDLDKMVAEPMEEQDVEAYLSSPQSLLEKVNILKIC